MVLQALICRENEYMMGFWRYELFAKNVWLKLELIIGFAHTVAL
jgi:hypothetical protein